LRYIAGVTSDRVEGKGYQMTKVTGELDLGTGIYSLAEASRIVRQSVGRASPRQVHYWVREGLSESVVVDGVTILSFQDLVSLEMVSRFRHSGVSLHAIKAADRELRARHPGLRRPFANSVFYTEGKSVWTLVGPAEDPDVIELFKKTDQYVWRRTIETFATEITFTDGTASSWRPTQWVEINPHVQFGEPVVAGTRVPVRTVAANLQAGSPEEVADWYALTVEQVLGAEEYFAKAA